MFTWPVGNGLELRLLEESNAEEFYAAVERNRQRLRPWLPWVDRTLSVDDVRCFMRTALDGYVRGEAIHAGVWVAGRLMGGIGYRKIDWNNRSTSIGYWLDVSVEGKGVMTRCCRCMLDHLFEVRKLHRVEIRCATGNTRSCAIPERLGFTREGISREAEWVNGAFHDLAVWSMLAHDWRAIRAKTRR